MNIDTERLITEVRLHPELWELSNEFHKDRDARISAWRDICKELFPDFDNKSDSEKKEIDKQVQQWWKTARDAYKRCKNSSNSVPSGSGGKKRKTYVFYAFMKFLDNKRDLNSEDSIEEQIKKKMMKELLYLNLPETKELLYLNLPETKELSMLNQPETKELSNNLQLLIIKTAKELLLTVDENSREHVKKINQIAMKMSLTEKC